MKTRETKGLKENQKKANNSCQLALSESTRNSSREEFLSMVHQKHQRKFQRKPIRASVIHQVHLRDEGQCTYYDKQGKRCSSKCFLEVHHKRLVSQGGDNSVDNLQLLCSGHHKVCHTSSL